MNETKIKCIYCNAEKNITDSDIIPYALTGAKLHKEFVCEIHNRFINDNYEKDWINSLAVFRNLLGFTTRDGNNISYKANVSMGKYEIENVKYTNISALLENKKSVYHVKGDSNTLLGNIDILSKIATSRGAEISNIDLSPINISTSLSSTSFTSNLVLHAVAKIAYESHCYFNNINEYNATIYSEIVDYLLNPNDKQNIVEIITDLEIYKTFGKLHILGTNILFEFDATDGYRYVVFGLWNVLFYKVRICQSKNWAIRRNLCEVYLFFPDGEFGKDIIRVREILSENAVDALNKIFPEVSKRLAGLYQPYFSYKSLLRQKRKFESKLTALRNGKITVNEFLEIGNIATISYIYMFEFLLQNKNQYRREATFLENLYSLNGSSVLELSDNMINHLISKYRIMNERGEFVQMLDNAFNFFDTLKE